MNRIGVYLCDCGPNIAGAVDMDSLAAYCRTLPDVVFARRHAVLCAPENRCRMADDIAADGLTHVVVAACSPKEHERTFREVLREGGLNPYLLRMVPVREQCAWVTPDRRAAAEKAKILIRAAVQRAAFSTALSEGRISCCADLLVAGAGISGISAALAAAGKDRRVYLIETLPCIGGRSARFETLFPGGECAACLLEPLLDAVLHHDRITVLTRSEIESVLGFMGNFLVLIRRKAGYVMPDPCLGCGACAEACPVSVPDAFNEGLNCRKAVYIPYPGALPNVAGIDPDTCLHFSGESCSVCAEACPFGAIDLEQRDCIEEIRVGGILLATGCDTADIGLLSNCGGGRLTDVYSLMEFERLASSTGPTEGRLVQKNGAVPLQIALVACPGSLLPDFPLSCSAVCGRYMDQFAMLAMEKLPEAAVQIFLPEGCLAGAVVRTQTGAASERVRICRMAAPGRIDLYQAVSGIGIRWQDAMAQPQESVCDMAVLAPLLTGAAGAAHLSRCLDVPIDAGGFFQPSHPVTAPVSTLREGIWIAGCARGPCSMPDAVSQGQAAAGLMMSRLIPGETLPLPARVSEIDPALCSGCRVCLSVCPFGAIGVEDSHALVREALCRGCGACAAACPCGAITARDFTDRQLIEEIAGLLQEPETDSKPSPVRN